MTLDEPASPQGDTVHGPVLLDRLERILRAARVEPAPLPEQRRDEDLVQPDGDYEQAAHTNRLGERPLELRSKRAERGVRGRGPRDNQQTKATAGKHVVENRRDSAAHGVSNHCFSDGFPNRDADDRSPIAGVSLCAIDGQGAAGNAPSALPQPVKVGRATQTGIPAHQTVRR